MPTPRLKAEYDRLYPDADRRNYGLHSTVDLSAPWEVPAKQNWFVRSVFSALSRVLVRRIG